MFVLDGKPLSPDRAFTHNGIQYPKNWLRLTTLAEKEAIGITEVPDPPSWDQRFAWGYDADGNLIWKDHAELVTLWVGNTRKTAGTLLSSSDWMVVREADNGTVINADWKAWRESVRTAAAEKVTAIEATADSSELATYITGETYNVWPRDPDSPEPVSDSADDGVVADGDGADAGPADAGAE